MPRLFFASDLFHKPLSKPLLVSAMKVKGECSYWFYLPFWGAENRARLEKDIVNCSGCTLYSGFFTFNGIDYAPDPAVPA